MNKEYTKDINSFWELEKALNEWFNAFKEDVFINGDKLTSLASLSKFTYSVDWSFNCDNNNLISLKWCPTSVGWNFDCNHNDLITLEWGPKYVGLRFSCVGNKITTLKWCPQSIGLGFHCSGNKLTTLEWCPKSIEWSFECSNNQLTTLEWYPKTVGWSFRCQNNNFIPLEEKKKWKIFKLWDSIYIGSPVTKDLQILIKWGVFINGMEESQTYYNSFNNFIKSTVKLDKKDITNTDITFNGKKYKRGLLNI
jgi:hypothetical protein